MNGYTFMKNVIIYGAGKIGALLYMALSEDPSYKILFVWDKSPETCLRFPNKDVVEKIDIDDISFEDIGDYPSNITIYVTIFSPAIAKDVERKLKSVGFDDVVSDRSHISRLLYESCQGLLDKKGICPPVSQCFQCPARRDADNPCKAFDSIYSSYRSSSMDCNDDDLVIDTLGFLLTTKCNLTCVGCNHLRDQFRSSDNVSFNADNILDDLYRIIDAVDFIKTVVVVGGEAMVHPDFATILRDVIDLPKIGFIQLITNGSYPPRDKSVFDLLRSDRVMVEVSGYGDVVGVSNVKKRNLFLQDLASSSVNYRYDETASWTDFGDFHHRELSSDNLKSAYSECCFISNDLFDGKLHKCSRSAYGQFIGKLPHYKNDYVDVRDSTNTLRYRIKEFLKIIPEACQHCNGTSTKTIPAGVQVVSLKRTT